MHTYTRTCINNILLFYLDPSSVQDPLVTLVDGELINITWSPPIIPNGIIHQYIIKRINSSGTFYYHVSANQHHIVLPYYNDALLFVSAVNLFGQSNYEHVKPKGICFGHLCIYVRISMVIYTIHVFTCSPLSSISLY